MDKDWKLQRYTRKDYTDVVDFPVEIVGRDGVVRRYSFEDSIRLYQRRITFAPIRYHDEQLIEAEVGHCHARIEQLRRSYFHRFGWGTPDGEPDPIEVFGDVAGELAAFLVRVFRSDGRPDVVMESLAHPREAVSTWGVVKGGGGPALLLYAFRFEDPPGPEEGEVVRERFFGLLRALEQGEEVDDDRERLVAFHHTVDCGFVLTARAGDNVRLSELRGDSDVEQEPTPWEEILEVLRKGDFADGVARCRSLVADQPYHRRAYLAGAVSSAALRRYWDAEDFAMIGARYFPDEPALHHYTGLARYRLGRLDEAEAALREALRAAPGHAAARFLLASVLIDTRRLSEARRVLSVSQDARGDSRRGDAAIAHLAQWLHWRRVMGWGAAASFVLGLAALATGGWIGLLPIALSLGIATAGTLIFRRQLDDLRARQRQDEIAQGLRRVHRRLAVDEPLVS